jgi:uncharacterized hydrophobic protein (TIGR00271 family)
MKKILRRSLSLKENTDYEKAISTISDGVSLQGHNLWLLLCSTMLASIGLDTNSTAVIIGAMLISPLMSPILGVGLSTGTHNRSLLIRSLRDLLLAVIISLAVSVIYFIISPLGEPTAELQARTYPTLLDVLIALFGGVAGIIAISRKQQLNAIPGVAIATALMPPLCTAGFGIATQHWTYFFGAFYLFFINAVFITLATYIIVKYLQFPSKEFINRKTENRYRLWLGLIACIVLTPSAYFLYTLYKSELIKNEINELVLAPIQKQGNEILKWEIDKKDSIMQIKVYNSGKPLSDSLQRTIDSSLRLHSMKSYSLSTIRLNLTKEEVDNLSAETVRRMLDEMHFEELKQQALHTGDTLSYAQVFHETKIAFPFIDTMYNGWLMLADAQKSIDTIPAVFYKSRRPLSKNQTKQVYDYLLARFQKDTLMLINEKSIPVTK